MKSKNRPSSLLCRPSLSAGLWGCLSALRFMGRERTASWRFCPPVVQRERDRFQHQSSLDNFTIIEKLGMLDTINTNVAAQTQRISDMDRRIERIENAMIENSLIERK